MLQDIIVLPMAPAVNVQLVKKTNVPIPARVRVISPLNPAIRFARQLPYVDRLVIMTVKKILIVLLLLLFVIMAVLLIILAEYVLFVSLLLVVMA